MKVLACSSGQRGGAGRSWPCITRVVLALCRDTYLQRVLSFCGRAGGLSGRGFGVASKIGKSSYSSISALLAIAKFPRVYNIKCFRKQDLSPHPPPV